MQKTSNKAGAAKSSKRTATIRVRVTPSIKVGKLSPNTVKRIVDTIVRSRKKK